MNTMTSKKMLKQALSGLIGLAAVMSIGYSFAGAGIEGSQHDLGAGGGGQATTTDTGEVCVFCHTPHGSVTSAAVPLWNKALPASSSYTKYSSLGTSTLDGAITDIGSVSLACLSCHDGSQAMDVMINKPGSGGYDSAGADAFAAINAMSGSPIPNLGKDLTNDHPISIQYAGGGLSSAAGAGVHNNTKFNDADFKDVTQATVNGNPVWWVDGNTDGKRQKDEIMLYTRTMSSVVQPFVECASCHDPHNNSTKGTNQVAFLRKDNSNSQICLACHNK